MKVTSNHPLAKLARAMFPEYKGRKVYVVETPTITFHNLNWSEGSCTQYKMVRRDGKTADGFGAAPPWANPMEGKTVTMHPDFVVVSRSWSCGYECGLTVYVYAEPALPPAREVVAVRGAELASWIDPQGTLQSAGLMRIA